MSSVLYPEPVVEVVPGNGSSAKKINPLTDARWPRLVARHPRAPVFHSVEWLTALKDTYGYEPRVYTTADDGEELENGLSFCGVRSWLTGPRLVSLPFSDHCDPLFASDGDPELFAAQVEEEARSGKWDYVELRPLLQFEVGAPLTQATVNYHFHHIDLHPDPARNFDAFHKDSVQRKIRRAERERLRYVEGNSDIQLVLQIVRADSPPPPAAAASRMV
jgi:hypothetical protein